ncbi:MAG TPA: toll/interleukin-1 receptor domain-containing protein [Usitatibacter sp.]|nr:toll/interleukin-1 receptor domain-containing protein [Usitatibacter sp.]
MEEKAALGRTVVAKSLTEARQIGVKTAFLCHSHLDERLVAGLERHLGDEGWRLYIDWRDNTMPVTPNRETARRIQQKIIDCNYFLFLATANSTRSRWCPWEIGFADGRKDLPSIFIIPTEDGQGSHGNEYLQLYRRIDYMTNNRLGAWFSEDPAATAVRNL